MRKKRVALFLAAVMAMMTVLTACGSNNGESGASNSNNGNNSNNSAEGNSNVAEGSNGGSEENGKLTGHVKWATFSWEESKMQAYIDGFHEIYPDVTVEYVLVDGDVAEWLASQAATNSLPDAISAWGDLPFYVSQGWVYPLDEFVKAEPEYQYVPDSISQGFTFADHLYALPSSIMFTEIYMNLDLLDVLNEDQPAYNWTIDEFMTLTRKAATDEYSALEKYHLLWPDLVAVYDRDLSNYGYNMTTGQFDFTSGAWEKSMALLREMATIPNYETSTLSNGEIRNQGNQDDFQKKFGVDQDAVRTGKVLCDVLGTWEYVEDYRSWIDDLGANYDMYPFPMDAEVGYHSTMHADFGVMFSTVADEDVQAVYEFLKYMTFGTDGILKRLEVAQALTDESGNPTPLYFVPASSNPTVVEAFKAIPGVAPGTIYQYENMDKCFRADLEKSVPGFNSVINEYYMPVFNQVIGGQVDATAVMAELQQKCNEAIQKEKEAFDAQMKTVQEAFDAAHNK